MRVDRHSVPEQTPSAAIEFVRTRYAEQARAAEAGGLPGVRWLGEVLLEYVGARTVELDPEVEERETWLALRSAVVLFRDFVQGQAAPKHSDCFANAGYASHYFRFTKGDEALTVREWDAAWWPALGLRFDAVLEQLAELCPDDHAEGQALVALWSGQDMDTRTLDGHVGPALRAIERRDADLFDDALIRVLRRHRDAASARVRDMREGGYRQLAKDLISWEAVGLAALAHMAGMPIGVESGYLPVRLVTGAGPVVPRADGGPIARPECAAEVAAEWLDRNPRVAQRRIDAIQRFDGSLPGWFNVVYCIASDLRAEQGYRSVLDPRFEDPRSWEVLTRATEAAAQAFKLVTAPPGSMIAVTVEGRTTELPAGEVDDSYASGSAYTHAVALAWTTRSAAALDILARVRRFRRESEEPPTGFAQAIRALVQGGDARDALRAALEAPGSGDYAQYVEQPRTRLLERLVAGDHAGFDSALAEALTRYSTFYSSGSRSDQFDGQLNFEVLGLACRAADQGFPITVESDYLPRRVIEGAWLTSTR
ncbi:immunity 49 family protein [Nocardia huaxiensis]|uniref:immunity 49 family protein n=1 Tax=Nocardia huaxiensis TaxID=2755382 RepID=UPI001E3E3083|nr:immunity 49 family protein [Nocardia huaxiensis]UFS99185.1 immunity 49 family protein [Nocardia huaxiensis]